MNYKYAEKKITSEWTDIFVTGDHRVQTALIIISPMTGLNPPSVSEKVMAAIINYQSTVNEMHLLLTRMRNNFPQKVQRYYKKDYF